MACSAEAGAPFSTHGKRPWKNWDFHSQSTDISSANGVINTTIKQQRRKAIVGGRRELNKANSTILSDTWPSTKVNTHCHGDLNSSEAFLETDLGLNVLPDWQALTTSNNTNNVGKQMAHPLCLSKILLPFCLMVLLKKTLAGCLQGIA